VYLLPAQAKELRSRKKARTVRVVTDDREKLFNLLLLKIFMLLKEPI
jgi:hypothetical protein